MILIKISDAINIIEKFVDVEQIGRLSDFMAAAHTNKDTIKFISTDSRKSEEHLSNLNENELAIFITLEGNFPTDKQVNAALDAGYQLIFTGCDESKLSSYIDSRDSAFVCYLKRDCSTVDLLQEFAYFVRSKVNPFVIAITGSSGKTSLKEILYKCLSSKYNNQVLATKGNFNNHLGVAFTLLDLTYDHKIAIIEHGANHLKEIHQTTRLSLPDVSIINNVQLAHTEGFGGIENIAVAKSEIFDHLAKDGIRVINLDSYLTSSMFATKDQQRLYAVASTGNENLDSLKSKYNIYDNKLFLVDSNSLELKLDSSRFNLLCPQINLDEAIVASQIQEQHDCNLTHLNLQTNLIGSHQCHNIAMAVAALISSKLLTFDEIQTSIGAISFPKGRNAKIKVNDKLTIIDDTYNANVGSMKASINLMDLVTSSNRIFVTGSFSEIGDVETTLIYKNLVSKILEQLQNKENPMYVIGPFIAIYEQNYVNGGKVNISLSSSILPLFHGLDNIFKMESEKTDNYDNHIIVDFTDIKYNLTDNTNYILPERILVERRMDHSKVSKVLDDFYSRNDNDDNWFVIFKGSNSSKVSECCADFIKKHSIV